VEGLVDAKSEFSRLGPYVLLRASGAGGMARIDLALREGTDAEEVCVLKRLHADFRSPEQEARFRREADIARRLSHDAIARTLEVDEIDGELLLLQELVMGVDLRRLSARIAAIGERLPVPLAVYVVSEVARALDYAHGFGELGIVHRDVTPDNIMLAFSGAVKLVDFGIARSNADTTVTQAGFVVGRPTYTAPEIWQGARADCRADLYSLGVVLWQLLTGRPLDSEAVPNPSSLSPDVPPGLAAVNLRAFDPDPDRRYSSAGALYEALTPYLPAPFDASVELSELLARHFDVAREQRMLAEDVARAKPLLASGRRSDHRPSTSRWTARSTLLLVAAVGLLLFNGVLVRLTRERIRGTTVRSMSATVAPASMPTGRAGVVAPAAFGGPAATVAPTATVALPSTISTMASGVTPSPEGADRPHEAVPRADIAPAAPKSRPPAVDLAAHPSLPAADIDELLAGAQANFDRGDLAAALALARNAARGGAGSPAYILIGTVMMNRHRYDEAERAFTEAARLDPRDTRAARLLAMVREIRKIGDARP
jgi:tRNA A-37 threonylcarbamoyl transferase component Bud32/tetratricopeptide (TPR) repeat protein